MRFSSLTFILLAAGASLGFAAPLDKSSAKTAVTDTTDATGATDVTDVTDATKWTCDNGWEVCGKCNGTSCKVAGINTNCNTGSCGGPKGGDGKHCGWGKDGVTQCPGF